MTPLQWTRSSGFVDTQAMFDDKGHGGNAYGHVIKAAWQSVVMTGNSKAGLKLSSGSIDLCQLGDLIAFLVSDMATQVHGVLFGLGTFMLRQVGMWLERKLPLLLTQEDHAAHVHGLKGMFGRSLRRDPRRLAGALMDIAAGHSSGLGQWGKEQESPDQHAARITVWSYTKLAQRLMAHENLSRGMCMDAAKAAGESMLLAFSYSPVINLGAFLPFQVPLPLDEGHVYEAVVHLISTAGLT
jgi:hypothetical protein